MKILPTLSGGILEAFGKLYKDLKVYAYPMKNEDGSYN